MNKLITQVTVWFVGVILGALLLSLITWVLKFLYDYFIKSRKIVSVLSVHNSSDRFWRKGVYARDRFMQIYEENASINSGAERLWGNGAEGAAYPNNYLDKFILEKYKLVSVFEENGRKKVKIKKNRIVRMVFGRIKRTETKERKRVKKWQNTRLKPSP